MLLTGSVQKNDIVDRLISIIMAEIGVMHKFSDDYSDDDFEASLAISYTYYRRCNTRSQRATKIC